MRIPVQQRLSSLGPKPATPAGDVNGEWTHDLHSAVNNRPNAAQGSLAARISGQGSKRAAVTRTAKLASALQQAETRPEAAQFTIKKAAATPTGPRGLSIRGLAGPFTVIAQNFAPGTTAADIESAMTPYGGEMLSCIIVTTSPVLVAEMVFSSREGGEAVISMFNNQTVSVLPQK